MRGVTEWLESIGLPEYAQRFAENGIDLSVRPRPDRPGPQGPRRSAGPSPQDPARASRSLMMRLGLNRRKQRPNRGNVKPSGAI